MAGDAGSCARPAPILDEPPAELHDVPDADLEAVLRVLGRLSFR